MAKQTFTTGQVLTAAQMTSLQQTAMLGGAASAKTASYTLVAADAGTAISMSNASATTITVNTALFAAGDTVQITNLGAGVCTITAGTATVNTSASLALAQYESGTLDFTSTSAAIFIKGAGAAPSAGGMTLLSTTTISNQASVSLTSISGDYLYLVALIQNYRPATDGANLNITLNNDTGTSYFTSFSNYTSSAPTLSAAVWAGGVDNGTSSAFAELTFFNYANTTTRKYFEFRNLDSNSDTPTVYQMNITRGYWGSNNAINRIDFGTSGGNITSGTILLYGVK